MKFERKKLETEMLPPSVLAKWSHRTLDEGFLPYAKRLLRCARFLFVGDRPMRDHTAMMAIIDYQRENLKRRPSLSYLAFNSGMSPKQFRECLQRFVDRDWIALGGDDDGLDINYSKFLKVIMNKTEELDEKARRKRRERDH